MRGQISKRGEEEPKRERVVIPHDAANECYIVGAAALDSDVLNKLAKGILAEHFVARENAEAWAALLELHRKKIEVTYPSIEVVASSKVADYISELSALANADTSGKNLEWHVNALKWDAVRVKTATTSLPAFLEALRDPRADASKVISLAKSIAGSFDGYQDRSFLLSPTELVRSQMAEIEKRVSGHAAYSYGIDSLDWYDTKPHEKPKRRALPGSAPGQVTVVTGVSGSGKTTVMGNLVLGMRREKRRILYGAWEVKGGMTLEMLSILDLGWSRSLVMEGDAEVLSRENRIILEERMHEISRDIMFLANPFKRKTGERPSNERNLDILQGYIEDSGCDVFVGDLWKRCLAKTEPDEEEQALYRQQAMAEETNVHCFLIQQQRLKDVEQRPDKRPTREGIKGSATYVEIADTIIGTHRPALFKAIDDDQLEIFFLKQRFGKWPVGVTFDWNAEFGKIENGRSIEYDRPGTESAFDNDMGAIVKKGKGKKPWG